MLLQRRRPSWLAAAAAAAALLALMVLQQQQPLVGGFVLRPPSTGAYDSSSSLAAPRCAPPRPAAAPAAAAPPSSSSTLIRMRASGDDGDGQEEEGDGEGPRESTLPTDRPLTSVEKRRIERASKTDSARKLSKNQRMLDDFLGKRMGQGNIFYGESLADMDDDQYAKKVEDQGKNDKDERLEIRPLRENPVLVVGATGGTGQWVVTDLLSKGFSVRALVRSLEKAEDLFGWDGANLDVFEGDVRDLEALREATRGALAVIYCAGSREVFGGNSPEQVDGLGVENAVRAARESGAGPGAPPSVRKFILLSSVGASRPEEAGFLGKLLGDPLRAKARGEAAVRRGGLESYCIVRAAGLRDGDGVKRRVELGQGDRFGRAGSGGGGASVSRLDVAAMLVQALVQDVNNVTFEVRNTEQAEDRGRLDAILGTSDQRQIVEFFLREDAKEEEHWAELLSVLVPDAPDAAAADAAARP